MRQRDADSFFEPEEEVERLVFTGHPVEEPRPRRAQDPAPRPRPKAISSQPGETWIPGDSKKKKKDKNDGGLSRLWSTVIYTLGLTLFIGGIYWIVVQVASVYAG